MENRLKGCNNSRELSEESTAMVRAGDGPSGESTAVVRAGDGPIEDYCNGLGMR